MTESQPNAIFGIHTLTAYNVTTGNYLGRARVDASAEVSSEGELIPLNGGSSKYPWKVERGLITAEVALTFREYPSFLFETLLGKAMTINAAETSGNVSTLTNKNGVSAVATTGVATATAESGEEASLKFSKFVVVAASSTTVDVYAGNDVDFANGDDLVYVNDLLKITASPLTITTSTAVTIPNTGVELTGGSGTIALVTGDTATFETRPINTGSREVTVGGSTDVFNDFGLIISSGRQGDGTMSELDCFRCAGAGLPINFTENAFSEASVTISMYRDTAKNGIMKYRDIIAS